MRSTQTPDMIHEDVVAGHNDRSHAVARCRGKRRLEFPGILHAEGLYRDAHFLPGDLSRGQAHLLNRICGVEDEAQSKELGDYLVQHFELLPEDLDANKLRHARDVSAGLSET